MSFGNFAVNHLLIIRAVEAGTPAAWVTAHEVYGQDPQLRAELAHRGLGYVLAMARSHAATTAIGARPVIELAGKLPPGSGSGSPAGPAARDPAGMTGR